MADKHILLTFLSDYKPDSKESFVIKSTKYITSLGEREIEGYNSSEPAVKYVIESIKDKANLDKIFVFTSKAMNREITYKLNKEESEDTLSHYSLFKKNLQKQCQNLNDNSFEKTDFNEIDNATDNTYNAFSELVKSATSMADKIIAFKREAGCDIVIHVDLTGGLRIAAFLISTVVQLLEHQKGITIKDYIYSQFFGINKPGKIFNATEIVQSSSLAAGAEAFVKYGSTEVLEDYFNEKYIPNLRLLLDAMKEFAEALQICSARLPKRIKKLKRQIETFESKFESKKAIFNEYESLFNVFLEKIKDKYKKLFAELDGRESIQLLNIMEWCKENNYVQQEVTFATELIPRIIYLEKIFYYDDEEAVKEEYFKKNNKINKGKDKKGKKDKDKLWQELSDYDRASFFIKSYKHEAFEPYGHEEEDRFSEMIKREYARTNLNSDVANKICYKYLEINKIRNKINHAANKRDIEDVKQSLSEMIETLKRVILKQQGKTE